MKWQKKLTKAELKHVKDSTVNCTLKGLKRNREFQKRQTPDACYECKAIASKLGIE